jgi:hypothetical protein
MTTDQIRPLLARLSMAFGQPYGLTSASADELARTWLNVVGDCELRDLSAAVDQWIRTQKKWPVPAMIREDAWQLTRARKPARAVSTGFCMRCHAPDLIDLANGRFMPLHADVCPGLHEMDRLDIQHALATGRAIWRDGSPPKPRLTAEAADD